MGIYLNPDNRPFSRIFNSEIYVDHSLLIEYTNRIYDKDNNMICVSRPRRFGKSTDANMLVAYYSKGCDSRKIFDNLKINKYKHVIFVSNESKKDLCNIYPQIKNKSVTINNLVDYKTIVELSQKKLNIKKTRKRVFLFVGRLDESSKRLTLLLDVAKKCNEENINAVFWIVGSGPDEKKYKNIVKKEKLNNVLFLGAKKNPYPYVKACDYLVLTSRYEGFPVVYNEAIVLNKPIITTIDVSDDCISIPNRFGYVVSENDIYDKIKELSTRKEKINEKVNFESINNERIKLLERIMENKR